MTIGEKIRFRRRALGITVRELADRVGVSRSALSKWENNQTKGIPDPQLRKLAEVLDCNILWLLDMDDAITADGVLEELPQVRWVPIIGEIACGDPILAVENHDGAANVPEDSPADFALRCTGDSMINARIFPGDLVLIRQGLQLSLLEDHVDDAAVIRIFVHQVILWDDRILVEFNFQAGDGLETSELLGFELVDDWWSIGDAGRTLTIYRGRVLALCSW